MIEVLLVLCSTLLLALCLLGIRIAHRLDTLHIHITLQNRHTVTIEREDEDNGDESEAWRNN